MSTKRLIIHHYITMKGSSILTSESCCIQTAMVVGFDVVKGIELAIELYNRAFAKAHSAGETELEPCCAIVFIDVVHEAKRADC